MADPSTQPATTATAPAPPDRRGTAPDKSSGLGGQKSTRGGDAAFKFISTGAGAILLLIMGAIAAFLVYKSIDAFTSNDGNFFTEKTWTPDPPEPGGPSVFGIAALTYHTVVTGIIAMLIAVPVAIGIALFITFYAPRRLSQGLAYLVDLLAAVPSVVYGLWGLFFLVPNMTGLTLFLDQYLGWIPLFDYRPDDIPGNRSDFTVGIVLAVMILPIVAAITREVFRQVPPAHVEGALALGATRWEMIRLSVLPFGRAGMVSAAILGLGRALGETLAVTIILASAYNVSIHITENGGVTFASNIANKYDEAGEIGTSALIASGLCLFVITLIVNSLSQLIVRRKKEA
ncbi:phosphate ABC transporter permease subunit PstC [Cryptosporangium aurantiacum]|uniref:Phosphate transport system permease protein n=1 Tax=Cryptosporangium aurantiacum TaxID=134849 RepID=A0A1M7RHQ8_9ACTN|nr:phosphate ABC transporter permease subunit PstC [Cryptosporangium aurantiacum]SHN45689.1 phosphate ABC transporter membrane protein 1, PhoT family [Cryptosporangium aurantiacum]